MKIYRIKISYNKDLNQHFDEEKVGGRGKKGYIQEILVRKKLALVR